MKKILCLILCLVMGVAMLVGCDEGEIGGYIENYPENVETIERLDLNLYIITGDSTSENAKVSVATRIAGHTKTEYNTVLNVHYVNAADYEATVMAAINAGGENVPHIVLINSESMKNALMNAEGGNKLVELTSYYKTRDYGRLNTQISQALIDGSKIDGRLYTVPNNRVIGEYTYLVINRAVVRDVLKFTNEELNAISTQEQIDALRNEIANLPSYNAQMASELVYTVSGSYQLREELSKDNFCNVIAEPTVSAADAFSSAFAIVNTSFKYNERAMQMIYALNNDTELRNLLQYGVQGANYNVVDGNIVRIKDAANTYDMSLEYTGDVFKANYCSELNWTKDSYDYGLIHNNESTFSQ